MSNQPLPLLDRHAAAARSLRSTLTSAALLGLLGAWPGAHAAPVYQTIGFAQTLATTSNPNYEQSYFTDTFNYLNDARVNAPSHIEQHSAVASGGDAEASVTAQSGVLKAFARAGYPAYTDEVRVVGYSYGDAQARFGDTILVGGAGLALGTAVSYSISFHIDGWHSFPAYEVPGHFAAGAEANMLLRDVNSGSEVRRDWSSTVDLNGWTTLMLHTEVGHELFIAGFLAAYASVDSYATVARVAVADYGHSANYFLTPSIDGLNTVGASGHDFRMVADPNSVPEPTSLALLLLGLLTLKRRHGVARGRQLAERAHAAVNHDALGGRDGRNSRPFQ